jgi:peroxiredoxin Q/BCP
MRKLLIGILGSAAVALPALAALDVGAMAPQFDLKASLDGKAFDYSLKDALKNGPVVVYFYPSAYTQGCDIQAHTFSESIGAFKAAGASVVGVSLDSIERLNDFSADPDYCAGNFPVASDAGGAVARSYGLNIMQGRAGAKDVRGVEIGHDFTERTTFVVTPDGKIAAQIGGIAPDVNVQESLAAVKKLMKH